jgi:hypothetical protein
LPPVPEGRQLTWRARIPNRDPGWQGGRRTGYAEDIERHAMPSTEHKNPSVVLVHGAYADGSSWSEVVRRLQAAGIAATAGAESADVAG